MHGQAVEQVAADAVEGGNHRRDAVVHGAQILHKLIGGNTPATDLAVNEDFDHPLGGFTARVYGVPGFILHWHALARPVVNARSRFLAHGCSLSSIGTKASRVV
ncbi:hypothetical protein D3C86_1679810 [compost metagenome]